jgi:hypothetical protein
MKTFQPSSTARLAQKMIPSAAALALFGFCHVAEAISLRFLPLTEEVAGRKIGIQDGERLIELKDLNPKKRSKAYTWTSSQPPALVALDRQRPNGKPAGVEIPSATDIESPLVLILADPTSASGIRAIVIDDSEKGFPWGTLRFVNTSVQPLMIRCEKETRPILGSLGSIDITPGGEPRNIGLQLFSETAPEAVLYSAVWEHEPNLRTLILIVPAADPASKELTLEIIPQDKRANL